MKDIIIIRKTTVLNSENGEIVPFDMAQNSLEEKATLIVHQVIESVLKTGNLP